VITAAAAKITQFIVLKPRFEGFVLNTDAMTDIPNLAAILLSYFATARIPRCDRLWTCPTPDPSPRLSIKLLSIALKRENLIVRCHRQRLRGQLLEHGYRAFFDRIEIAEACGWRLHFFSLDPLTILVLHEASGSPWPGKRMVGPRPLSCARHVTYNHELYFKEKRWTWVLAVKTEIRDRITR